MNSHIKIGLEIHVKLNSFNKLFCKCKSSEKGQFNEDICPICTGEPGTYPLLNLAAVKDAIRAAKLLKMTVNEQFEYVRKHYSYRDLPKGYQLTMLPTGSIGINGILPVYDKFEFIKNIPISSLILEEDPCSFKNGILNYQRAGTPLLEIVTEPVIKTNKEAVLTVKTLLNLLKTVNLIDPSNKKVFRADVNISVNNGKRVELKNIGSLQEIDLVIPAEIDRQLKESVNRDETRSFNPLLGRTQFMRFKENAEEYLYIPEPNIKPVHLKNLEVEEPYNVYEATFNIINKHPALDISRAWGYALNQTLGRYLLSKNFVNYRVIDLMVKYKKQINYSLLDKKIDEGGYRKLLFNNKKPSFTVVYNELLATDSKFAELCKIDHIYCKSFTYVIGSLKKKTGLTYSEIIQKLNKIWSN